MSFLKAQVPNLLISATMIMSRLSSSQTIIVVFLVFFLCSCNTTSSGSSRIGEVLKKTRCKEAERNALLKIKKDLQELMGGDGLLISWGSEKEKTECCEWVGIRCANKSGRVIRLDLSPSALGISDYYLWALRGKISPSLLDLKYLKYLDLSFINFTGSQIPSSIGTLRKLRYLNLSYTYVGGEIPSQLANLSNLQSLDLGYNFRLWANNLEWLSHLSSLKDLVLSHSNLSKADDWLQIVSNFPHLTNLQLAVCKLPDVVVPPSLSLANSSKSLAFLDLCCNSFSVSIYQWLFNFRGSLVYLELSLNRLGNSIPEAFGDMSSLAYLDLGQNQLEGSIPEAFGNLTSLEFLDLSNNSLQGEIPRSIWYLPVLSFFSVELNNLTGELPESIGKLSQLEVLRVSGNSLRGVISEAHFANLSNLSDLGLSSNSLILNLSSDWIPPFRLDVILLRSCKMGPRFPNWLQTQKNYLKLDISSAGISDSIPNWFWGLSTELLYLNISNNNISGNVPNFSLEFTNANEIDLRSNQFEGPIPVFLFKVSALHLSGNRFSELNSMCDVTNDVILTFLDLSDNQFSGKLPDCWSHFKQLRVLTLGNNRLSGKIPFSIGSLTLIDTLNLSNNSFVGELPASLKNCTELVVFDVSENNLTGQVPAWIGKSLPYLVILSLRSNHFNGNLPSNVCDLPSLQVLDLSLNNLSGSLPNCLNLLAAMKRSWSPDTTVSDTYVSYPLSPRTFYFRIYDDGVQLCWKGKLSEFINNLGLLKSIDLSSNKFTGEIPQGITKLVGLVSLNLSRNDFSGQIPSEIGRLNLLDYLDLSNNRLSGRIPSSLTEVSRLTTLDLSNNNLSGKIPTSTQLQSFDAAAYMGNLDLCGDPLPKKCPGEEPTVPGSTEEPSDKGDHEEGFVSQGFYLSLGLGFVFGFWGVFGTLLFKKSWRFAYFNFLDDVKDWIYVMAAVQKAKLLALIQG